ncbi:RNA demethylase ALKBH10B-like isoform X1 [Lolium rigidum]|uniref:RNA demethylase ALKBH10B-like isoform X1 n=1 Tax=Lolium rigidum TaxID=89674 RepID=UPI001F5E0563|nr:RNA demethylase ALKBH10B-like isoform X1 [Lolium rigidum]
MTTSPAGSPGSPVAAPDQVAARDAVIGWYRGEFAAANAVIDALCGHLAQIGGAAAAAEYDAVFAALHRRRLNWFPVLHMQKFYSVNDVAAELRRVADARAVAAAAAAACCSDEEAASTVIQEPMMDEPIAAVVTEAAPAAPVPEHVHEPVPQVEAAAEEEVQPEEDADAVLAVDAEQELDGEDSSGDSSERKAASTEDDAVPDGPDNTDQGSQGSLPESYPICSDHEDCIARPERIKIQKGFMAKESVKGHMVNVVKGLKIYEDVFTTSELVKVADFINGIRQAGRNGELSGETFIFFNKQIKGNKREIIQLGVPLFQHTTEESNCHIEPIPVVLQAVIDHLVLWRLIPESRKPNSVIINFFDEDEHSQPYFKPPHLDNPISTLLLSETSMAFGRSLVTDNNGNYKGPLTLSLKHGSLLVMRGNSADMARHVVCPSSNRRVSITFVRVRPSTPVDLSPLPSPTKAMTLWQPPPTAAAAGMQKQPHGGNGAIIGYGPAPQAMLAPAWGMAVRAAPMMMVAPARPMVMAPSSNINKRMGRGGTGVFLPWTVGPKRYNKHLPPRIQKRRFSAMMSPIETQG